MPNDLAQLPAFLIGFARILPMLHCVFVAERGTRPRRTAMHATAVSPAPAGDIPLAGAEFIEEASADHSILNQRTGLPQQGPQLSALFHGSIRIPDRA